MKFTSSYLSLPSTFYRLSKAAAFPRLKLLKVNESLAQEIGFPLSSFSKDELLNFFSGQASLPEAEPMALAYAGYQFGHPVESLGDGRALLMGEIGGFDFQLKGSGQTPFSRRGDGRSALGPVVREYLLSEAMHALGVPTTRALAMVLTGENVFRQNGPEPGGIFSRIAPSHLRVGTFQYFYFKQDLESIKALLQYSIKRHYPELLKMEPLKNQALHFLKEFAQRQGDLIAEWSSLGFIHGVMNTDNCAIGGFTIDYGPCAFMEEFRFQQVFSSIDERGRYSYFNQVPIIQWNILRLADTLLPLLAETTEAGIKLVEDEIIPLLQTFPERRLKRMAKKLGIDDFTSEDGELVISFLTYLEEESLDFTLSFRKLPELYRGEMDFYPDTQRRNDFLIRWRKRVQRVDHLSRINPLYIPRNHLVQKAIELSYQGDLSFFEKCLTVFSNPFEEQEGMSEFSLPAKESEKVLKTFCGT